MWLTKIEFDHGVTNKASTATFCIYNVMAYIIYFHSRNKNLNYAYFNLNFIITLTLFLRVILKLSSRVSSKSSSL